jgi:hypothetical protein
MSGAPRAPHSRMQGRRPCIRFVRHEAASRLRFTRQRTLACAHGRRNPRHTKLRSVQHGLREAPLTSTDGRAASITVTLHTMPPPLSLFPLAGMVFLRRMRPFDCALDASVKRHLGCWGVMCVRACVDASPVAHSHFPSRACVRADDSSVRPEVRVVGGRAVAQHRLAVVRSCDYARACKRNASRSPGPVLGRW